MPPAGNDALKVETRMRRALGLTTNSPPLQQQHSEHVRHQQRFVRDGEIPTVVLSSDGKSDASSQTGSRLADLESALDSERAARASATRSLEEARTTIQSLQTRLAHAELAFDEMIAVERRTRAEAERALQESIAGGRTAAGLNGVVTGRLAEPAARRTRVEKVKAATPAKAAATPKQREPQAVKVVDARLPCQEVHALKADFQRVAEASA